MNRFFQVMVLAVLTMTFVVAAVAQKQKSKDEYFKEIVTLSNTKKPEDLEKAYQLSKEFLAAYPKEKGDNINKIKDFIKRYRTNSFYQAVDGKKYADAFAIGKEILVEEPENTIITLNLAYAGFDALAKNNDKTFADDSAKYAELTLQLLEKGNFPTSFSPFQNKDDLLAWMYYIHGTFTQEKDLKAATASYYKATLYESQIKNSSQPYNVAAYYYEQIYEKMSNDLKAKSSKLTDAEFKTENEKVDKVIDQMMDAYARACTFGTAEKNPSAENWKQRLTQIYQFRKKTTAGLDAYIKYVMTTTFTDPSQFQN